MIESAEPAAESARRWHDFDYAARFDHPVAWDEQFEPTTLVAMFERSAARHASRAMIDFYGRNYRYAEVLESVRRVARGLQDLGVGKGDRVGLYLPNVPHYVAAYYGALSAGATVVNFSPLYTVEELAHQVEDSGTRILFTLSAKALLPNALKVLEASSLERLVVGSVAGGLGGVKRALFHYFKSREVISVPDDPRICRFSALIDNDGRPTRADVSPDDVALIQYTGGTTGTPKGARLSHANLSTNAAQVVAIDHDRAMDDRIVGVLPFFHVFANTCVLNRTVMNGGRIVMLPRFDAGATLAAIKRTRATALPGVPTMYQALLDHPDIGKTDFSSLRVCISGGAPMPPELKARFEAATQSSVVEGYGLTESSGVVSVNPYVSGGKPGTIGQPLPGTRVRLADRDDSQRPAADGEPGELLVKGPQIMQGYWNRPEADGDSFTSDGWLRTGDVATIDSDGYIRIVDRLKDMIAVGGFKVYPSTIEAAMRKHAGIKEALVLGVPDPYRGEVPRAYVTLEDDATGCGEDGLRDWLNGQLGKHERVDRVVVRSELPKTMIGKLDRKALRAEVAQGG